MTIHNLTATISYFFAAQIGYTLFDVARYKGDFKIGDLVCFNELDITGEYTGRSLKGTIKDIRASRQTKNEVTLQIDDLLSV